jgi:hypothetical protein
MIAYGTRPDELVSKQPFAGVALDPLDGAPSAASGVANAGRVIGYE